MSVSPDAPLADDGPAQPPELTPRRVLYALVGLALHLTAGFVMLVSGLVAPPWAVVMMLFVWAFLLGLGLRMWRYKSWVTIVFPVIAFAVWIATLVLGEALFGWQA